MHALLSSDLRTRIRRGNLGVSRVDVTILITCLGLAVVIALPRHGQLAADTRQREVAALARSAASAAALAHSRWEATGRPAAVAGSRGNVAVVNGYPSVETLPLMLADAELSSFEYTKGRWQYRELPPDRACGVRYTPPVVASGSPEIRTLTDGC